MGKKNHSFTDLEEKDDAALEAKRNKFLDEIFNLHTKHLSHLAKKADAAEFLQKFEELSGENDLKMVNKSANWSKIVEKVAKNGVIPP